MQPQQMHECKTKTCTNCLKTKREKVHSTTVTGSLQICTCVDTYIMIQLSETITFDFQFHQQQLRSVIIDYSFGF